MAASIPASARAHATARTPAPDPTNGLVEQTHAVLAGMGWLSTGPASGGATRERWESLAAVLALAEEVAASGRSTMAELVEEFERRAQLSHAPTADGVTVTTLHSAKGLEWPVVFIIGASEGNLPIVYADTDARIEEERRLFYVGVTRAQDRLVVTWALTRPGSGRQRQASRFLASMRTRGGSGGEATSAGLVRQGRSGAAREPSSRKPPDRCRVCGAGLVTGRERTLGRCLKCPGVHDEQLAATLREWRDEVARSSGLPASIVLTDETLAAVEERRPSSEADLRDIPGFRPDKIANYGSQVLAIVAAAGERANCRGRCQRRRRGLRGRRREGRTAHRRRLIGVLCRCAGRRPRPLRSGAGSGTRAERDSGSGLGSRAAGRRARDGCGRFRFRPRDGCGAGPVLGPVVTLASLPAGRESWLRLRPAGPRSRDPRPLQDPPPPPRTPEPSARARRASAPRS